MIDLRSDTVTRPSPAMRKAMAEAPVGDDVWGDDPTVTQLEELAAGMLGMEAALYVPSGTQSNLIALMSHCQRGDEYLVGQDAHTYKYEGGGGAVLGSIQPQPLAMADDGTIPLELILGAIKPDDFHFARTQLLCLENTSAGRVLPMDYLRAASELAIEHNLGRHLDGARVFNAAVNLGINVREIAQYFDSVSICLSKGLGAPVGSVLCGPRDFIREARRWRKMLGGGMRQAGIIAAAGIYALQNNVARLKEDHENAALLARELSDVNGITLDTGRVQTNMVFITPQAGTGPALAEHLRKQDILVDAGHAFRMVTHLDVGRADILATAAAIRDFYRTT
ncbi:MAG: low-specificity L-threonine aldolase [Pseudomonadota bacterium]|nr:low-specificity L-threonine aldolase [Pseudomonadota bacterium]